VEEKEDVAYQLDYLTGREAHGRDFRDAWSGCGANGQEEKIWG